jgi:hypothetical protein
VVLSRVPYPRTLLPAATGHLVSNPGPLLSVTLKASFKVGPFASCEFTRELLPYAELLPHAGPPLVTYGEYNLPLADPSVSVIVCQFTSQSPCK